MTVDCLACAPSTRPSCCAGSEKVTAKKRAIYLWPKSSDSCQCRCLTFDIFLNLSPSSGLPENHLALHPYNIIAQLSLFNWFKSVLLLVNHVQNIWRKLHWPLHTIQDPRPLWVVPYTKVAQQNRKYHWLNWPKLASTLSFLTAFQTILQYSARIICRACIKVQPEYILHVFMHTRCAKI